MRAFVPPPCGFTVEDLRVFGFYDAVSSLCTAVCPDNVTICGKAVSGHPRAPTAFVTPSPSTSSRKPRNSAKQDSFRKKLIRRNKKVSLEDRCQICNETFLETALQAAHLFPLSAKDIQEKAYENAGTDGLSVSVNEASNGVMLCGVCHAYFDSKERPIKINEDGQIIISTALQKTSSKYKSLHNKLVAWSNYIDSRDWPAREQLKLAKRFTKRKRSDLADDLVMESEESEEDVVLKKKAKVVQGTLSKPPKSTNRKRKK